MKQNVPIQRRENFVCPGSLTNASYIYAVCRVYKKCHKELYCVKVSGAATTYTKGKENRIPYAQIK